MKLWTWMSVASLTMLAFARAAIPASAAAHELSRIEIPSVLPIAQPGWNSGLAISGGRYVRITASGELALINGPCGKQLTPMGCEADTAATQTDPALVPGVLAAAFFGAGTTELTPWKAVGRYAILQAPPSATKLLLKVYGLNRTSIGTYSVVVDALPIDPTERGSLSLPHANKANMRMLQGQMRGGNDNPAQSPTAANIKRADLQFSLRRLGFSATPEQVTSIAQSGGISTWVSQQIAPHSINDDAAANCINPIPARTSAGVAYPSYPDSDVWGEWFWETRFAQYAVCSNTQLQTKLWLHWLEHFSVDQSKVNNVDYWAVGNMAHYSELLHTEALGNFQHIVTDSIKEIAVQYWLDELFSNGNNAAVPPNENLGRELMQLYTIGTTQLNLDGTPVLDATGTPIAAYTEADVKQAALLLTGYNDSYDNAQTGTFPSYADDVTWVPGLHPTVASFTIMGHSIADPGGAQCAYSKFTGGSGPCVVDNFVSMLAHQPTTWAYESKELIQRLVNEQPSPAFVKRIATVWGANVDAPNQMATVITAIAADPEFLAGEGTMIKEPIEFEIDMVRALGGQTANVINAQYPTPLDNVTNNLNTLQQNIWYPVTVFGFYRPGNKETMLSTARILKEWDVIGNFVQQDNMQLGLNNYNYDIEVDLSRFKGSTNGPAMAGYLLDALVDGGEIELRTQVINYLANDYHRLPGALWIILTSPEYEVD